MSLGPVNRYRQSAFLRRRPLGRPRRVNAPNEYSTPPPPASQSFLAVDLMSVQQARLDASHNFDLPTPTKPDQADITLVLREIGKMVLPPGTTLSAAVAAIELRARVVLGAGAGPVKGVRDGVGSVDVGRWDVRSQEEGEWRVSIEWEW